MIGNKLRLLELTCMRVNSKNITACMCLKSYTSIHLYMMNETCVNYLLKYREFKLHLETHSGLFEPDFHVVIVGKDGRTTKRNMNTRGFVTGYVIGTVYIVVYMYM